MLGKLTSFYHKQQNAVLKPLKFYSLSSSHLSVYSSG
jgi:hypothetical protein